MRVSVVLLLALLAALSVSLASAARHSQAPLQPAAGAPAAPAFPPLRPPLVNDVPKSQHDKPEVETHYKNKMMKKASEINDKGASASLEKLKKLTRNPWPHAVMYYPGQQVFNDADVDTAARAIIDNPERKAYRKKKKDDAWFLKTVSNAHGIFTHHESLTKKNNPAPKPAAQAAPAK